MKVNYQQNIKNKLDRKKVDVKTDEHCMYLKYIGKQQEEFLRRLERIGKLMDEKFVMMCMILNCGKWQTLDDVYSFPVCHRLRLPYEIIFEFDNIERERAIKVLQKIEKGIKILLERKTLNNYILYLQDHYGRSPHLHFIPTSSTQYKYVKKFSLYFDIDHQINSGVHLVREIGSFYSKRLNIDQTTYASYFPNFESIVPITDIKDVKFPSIDLTIFKKFNNPEIKKVTAKTENNNEEKVMLNNLNYIIPPVIANIIDKFKKHEDVLHIERWVLAVYLVNIGKSDEEIQSIFKLSKKYNEKITQTQLNHIRKKGYVCPSYEKLKSIGFDITSEEEKLKNPLKYKMLFNS